MVVKVSKQLKQSAKTKQNYGWGWLCKWERDKQTRDFGKYLSSGPRVTWSQTSDPLMLLSELQNTESYCKFSEPPWSKYIISKPAHATQRNKRSTRTDLSPST